MLSSLPRLVFFSVFFFLAIKISKNNQVVNTNNGTRNVQGRRPHKCNKNTEIMILITKRNRL